MLGVCFCAFLISFTCHQNTIAYMSCLTSSLPAQAQHVNGHHIPGLQDVLGEGGQWPDKAEMHGQLFGALFLALKQGDPDTPPPAGVVAMLTEALEHLAARKLQIPHPNPGAQAYSKLPVNEWALEALFSENDLLDSYPATVTRLVLAYGRAGYFNPNATISPFGPMEPEMPLLEQVIRMGNLPAAEALIELGADVGRIPRKTRYDPLPRCDAEVREPWDEFINFLPELVNLDEAGQNRIKGLVLERLMREQITHPDLAPAAVTTGGCAPLDLPNSPGSRRRAGI